MVRTNMSTNMSKTHIHICPVPVWRPRGGIC